MSDRDYRQGLDGLQSDMANHQRRFNGGDVTSRANEKLAIETIERLEKQDLAAAGTPQPLEQIPQTPQHETRQVEVDGRRYTLDKAPDRNTYRTASEFEAQVMAHAEPRIKLLMSKLDEGPLGTPSWRTRTLSAMYFKVKSIEALKAGKIDEGSVYERAFQQDLYELLEASNLSFGDWRKDAPSRITVSG